MAIDTIKSSAVLDGAIATADIADDAVTGAKIENNPTIAGNLGVAGDLTVDTSSLKVNASNNFIGIGTASPQKKIHILDTTSDGNMIFDRNGTSTDHQIIFAHNYQSGGQSGGNYYGIGVDGSENKLVFAYDANSQASLSADAKMTLNSNGVLSVPSGVELGSGVDATAANILDDYEEGTWTPVITPETQSAASITVNIAQYTKVGRLVSLVFQVTINSISGTNNARAIELTGMPFTVNSGSTGGGPNIGYTNLNSMTGTLALQGFSTTLYRIVNLNGTTGLNASDHLQASSVLRGQFTYHTDQ